MERHYFRVFVSLVALLSGAVLLYYTSKLHVNVRAPKLTEIFAIARPLEKNQTNPWNTLNRNQAQRSPLISSTHTLLIPEDDGLRSMEMIDLEDLYMRYIENIQEACGVSYHMGGENDGGYHVCEKYIVKKNCLVYSFGSFRMFDFEDEIAKTYGCEIHTFDPFDGQVDHQHSPQVTFHQLGIASKDEGKLLKLGTIKKMLKHSEKILDVLKIDCEGAEWDALPDIISSGDLSRVKTLIIESHLCLGPVCKDLTFRTKERYITKLVTLRNIYAQGFRLYYFRLWEGCKIFDERRKKKTGCHEVHFMNVNF